MELFARGVVGGEVPVSLLEWGLIDIYIKLNFQLKEQPQ